MYALMSELCVMDHLENWWIRDGRRTSRRVARMTVAAENILHPSLSTNQKQTLGKMWHHLIIWTREKTSCIVTKDNFVYFIRGIEWPGDECRFLSEVDRYDLRKNQWDQVANIQRAREWAHGAAANNKIYIAWGFFLGELAAEKLSVWGIRWNNKRMAVYWKLFYWKTSCSPWYAVWPEQYRWLQGTKCKNWLLWPWRK